MHKYLILFFSVTLILCACNGNSVPDGVIEPKRMVRLLAEVHLIDGDLFNGNLSADSSYKYGTARYLVLFKKFKTDSAHFKSSMKYYTSNLEKLATMYDQVDTIIKKKMDSVTMEQKTQMLLEHKKDSIRAKRESKYDTIPDQALRRRMRVRDEMKAKIDSIRNSQRK